MSYSVKPTEDPNAFVIEGPGITFFAHTFFFGVENPQFHAEHTARQLSRAFEAGKEAARAALRRELGVTTR